MNGYRLFYVQKDKDGKEKQGIYPVSEDGKQLVYQTEDEAVSEYEIRLGNAMKSDNTDQATYLMVMNEVGQPIRQSYIAKTYPVTHLDANGEEITEDVPYEIFPRLIDIKATKDGAEVASMAKYDTVNDVHSNYHLKLGRAMQNNDVIAIVLYGIDTHGGGLDSTHWVRTYQPTEQTGE